MKRVPFAVSVCLRLLVIVALLANNGLAATFYWDSDASGTGNATSGTNLGGTGTWNQANANWWNGVAGTDTTFGAVTTNSPIFTGTAGTVTLAATVPAGMAGLEFDTTGYRIAGATQTLNVTNGSSINVVGSSTTAAIDTIMATSTGTFSKDGTGKLILGQTETTAINTGASTFNLNDGSVELNKTGTVIALSSTTINIGDGTGAAGSASLKLTGAGTNQIADTAALIVKSDGTFDLNGKTETVQQISTMSGGSITTASATGGKLVLGNVANALTATGTNTISSDLQLNNGTALTRTISPTGGSDSLELSGTVTQLTGAVAITKSGSGLLKFSGATSNTVAGIFSITDGSVQFNKSGSANDVASTTITIGDGTGAAGSASLKLSGASTNHIVDTATLTVAADGTFDLNGNTEMVGAVSTMSGGSITTAGAAGGVLALSAVNNSLTATGSNTISAGLQLTTAAARTRTFSITGASDSLNISGPISEAATFTGTVIKSGAGTLTLSGANSYSGDTSISAGTLITSGSNSSAGTTTVTGGILSFGTGTNGGLASGTLSLGAGTFQSTDATSRSVSSPLALTGNAIFGGTGDLNFTSTGSYTLTATRTLTVNNTNTSIATSLSGTSLGLTKAGTGTLQLSGTDTYTGTTTINAGTIKLAGASALSGGGPLTFGSGSGVLDLNGNGATVAALSMTGNSTAAPSIITTSGSTGLLAITTATFNGGGSVASGTGTGGETRMGGNVTYNKDAGNAGAMTTISGVLDLNSATDRTFAVADDTSLPTEMTISAKIINAGAGGLVKGGTATTGAGVLVLGGNNTYTGGTKINVGTVAISSDANLGASGTTVTLGNSTTGGTLRLTSPVSSSRPIALGSSAGATASTIDTGSTASASVWSGGITGTGTLVKNGTGSGALNLSGGGVWNGGLQVSGGTVSVPANFLQPTSTSATGSGLIVDLGSTLNVSGNAGISVAGSLASSSNGSILLNGTTNLSNFAQIDNLSATLNATRLTNNGSTTLNDSSAILAGGVFANNGTLNLNSSSIAVAGTVLNSAGVLNVNSVNAKISADSAVHSSGSLVRIDGSGGTVSDPDGMFSIGTNSNGGFALQDVPTVPNALITTGSFADGYGAVNGAGLNSINVIGNGTSSTNPHFSSTRAANGTSTVGAGGLIQVTNGGAVALGKAGVSYDALTVGSLSTAPGPTSNIGAVVVSDTNSRWDQVGRLLIGDTATGAGAGSTSNGVVRVLNGATMNITGNIRVGTGTTATGSLLVDHSTLNTYDLSSVGTPLSSSDLGGYMNVSAGGAQSNGQLIITGSTAVWNSHYSGFDGTSTGPSIAVGLSDTTGAANTGLIHIDSGATVNSNFTASSISIGRAATAGTQSNLNDSVVQISNDATWNHLSSSTPTNTGALEIGVRGRLDVSNGGRFLSSGGDNLNIAPAIDSNHGAVNISGQSANNRSTVQVAQMFLGGSYNGGSPLQSSSPGTAQLTVSGNGLLNLTSTTSDSYAFANSTITLGTSGNPSDTGEIRLGAGRTLDVHGTVQGNGQITGSLHAESDSTLSPGFSSGLVSVSNNLTIDGQVNFQLGSPSTSDYDRFRLTGTTGTETAQVNGTVSFQRLVPANTPVTSTLTYDLITAENVQATPDALANGLLSAEAAFAGSGYADITFEVIPDAFGDFDTLRLTVDAVEVPEPSSMALMAFGALGALLAGFRRQQRRRAGKTA